MAKELTRAIARKVLTVVDAGLVQGMGSPVPGEMCVEAAVCFAMGEPHGDQPSCVSPAVRRLKITLNDRQWSSNEARAKGMRRLAIAQLGTKDAIDDKEFAQRCAELAIRKMVPIALRAAAKLQKDAMHRQSLLDAANKCEFEGSASAAWSAESAARSAASAAESAASAASAAWSAASAAWSAESAASAARSAAESAARSAAESAESAASAARSAASAASAAYDKTLSDFAEDVVQILIDLKSPGCKWLDLTIAA